MKQEDAEEKIQEVIEIASRQIDGGYSVESDARQALELIRILAALMLERIDPEEFAANPHH